MDDFEWMKPDDIESIVKMHNEGRGMANKLGMPVQKKLLGFLHWYHDKTRRQLPVVAAEFTVDEMRKALVDFESAQSLKSSDATEVEVGKIKTGLEFFDWKEAMVARLESKRGVDGAPLARCIREDKPPGWTTAQAKSELEELIYQLPITGPVFDQDNSLVATEIKSVTLGEPIYEWLRDLLENQDGRGAWLALIAQCEGDNASNKRLVLANRVISTNWNDGGGQNPSVPLNSLCSLSVETWYVST